MRDPKSKAEARKAFRRWLLRAGWYDAHIIRAAERLSSTGDMIELGAVVAAPDGSERVFRDWLTTHDKKARRRRANCCIAVGAQRADNADKVSADLFSGHNVRVKIGIRQQRGWLDENFVCDYAPVGASIVHLRPPSKAGGQ